MSQTLSIDQIIKTSHVRHPEMLRSILETIKKHKRRAPYSTFMAGHDLGNDDVRQTLYETLVDLRKYTNKWALPAFHLFLVREDTKLPGPGVLALFRKIYGKDAHFDAWAEHQIKFAEFTLQSGLIELK
ncbi:MAG: hypothetical protein NTV34_03720 [Proteobacteria bacterium]|nr:hypothetical protein [Pseudomonadota bacterium]